MSVEEAGAVERERECKRKRDIYIDIYFFYVLFYIVILNVPS